MKSFFVLNTAHMHTKSWYLSVQFLMKNKGSIIQRVLVITETRTEIISLCIPPPPPPPPPPLSLSTPPTLKSNNYFIICVLPIPPPPCFHSPLHQPSKVTIILSFSSFSHDKIGFFLIFKFSHNSSFFSIALLTSFSLASFPMVKIGFFLPSKLSH